ncbi:MAG: hypothetical protein OET90_05295 [Desulfuromonadales bacterium]|nr:hypothetical protein [Desulfuromonadales bacterium]
MSDRNTACKDGLLMPFQIAAASLIEAGKLVAVNASGYLVAASDSAGLLVVGLADETVDNSSGADGEASANIRRNKAFKFGNDSGNPVTQAEVGDNVLVADDASVTVAAGSTNSIVAGKCLGVDSDGVWVWID